MFAEILRENAYGAYRVRLEVLLQIPTDASDRDIHELIEAGFSAGNVKALCDFGRMSPLEHDQIISPKALKTKLARGQRLTVDESDHLFRVAHIIAMAQTLFGDDEKAKHWLYKSKDCFSGKSPIAMLSTIQGTRRVEEMLIQLAEGLAF
ncbi:antitoxin [Pseudomonas sp. 43NM1]|uniref:antitoxin Xre/MbcA/ParS toxin-binding domain-containing protein n=1 Tax=Pseudomonas sp. 43NM1 TaxID=1904755 RepID=UPI000C3344EC|nr:antitoxin Xre/MbcA/ParS toxin-binding domain-containing protein [Pseudomonas sp. 43NM1]PKH39736.1 antitoxin [Pseudomonas sp. 43NM1]